VVESALSVVVLVSVFVSESVAVAVTYPAVNKSSKSMVKVNDFVEKVDVVDSSSASTNSAASAFLIASLTIMLVSDVKDSNSEYSHKAMSSTAT
jgi:hypothetical protein